MLSVERSRDCACVDLENDIHGKRIKENDSFNKQIFIIFLYQSTVMLDIKHGLWYKPLLYAMQVMNEMKAKLSIYKILVISFWALKYCPTINFW